jgi:hypothetical protein
MIGTGELHYCRAPQPTTNHPPAMTTATTDYAFLSLAVLAHAGLPLLFTPAAPLGTALLLICAPAAAVAAGIKAARS